eukprot:5124042-Pyramimonas_sp.AAC.1
MRARLPRRRVLVRREVASHPVPTIAYPGLIRRATPVAVLRERREKRGRSGELLLTRLRFRI